MESFELLQNIKILKVVLHTNDEIKKVLQIMKPEDDIFEVVGGIQTHKHIKNIGFKSKCFDKFANDEKLHISLLECPEVDEGMFTCLKCKSKRIFTASKQTRSGDEATTVFAKCSECKNQWVVNN